MKAVYAGSFDPITRGHLSVIYRAIPMFDRIFVMVGVNQNKTKRYLFTAQERVEMIQDELSGYKGKVVVTSWERSTGEFALLHGATTLIRGVRGAADIENELTMDQLNRDFFPELNTILFPCKPYLRHVSSTAAREAAIFGLRLDELVTPSVARRLQERISK